MKSMHVSAAAPRLDRTRRTVASWWLGWFLLSSVMGAPVSAGLNVGWAEQDITPPAAVAIAGQFHSRVSEGIMDPLTATILVLESGGEHAIWVSCDLVGIADELRDTVRARLAGTPSLDPRKVILHATHSHTAPELRRERVVPGVPLAVTGIDEVLAFTADRIAQAIVRAWQARAPGGFAHGLGHAVVGRNRRWVDRDGKSTMYGNISNPNFSHIEGFEDHNVNLIAAYDRAGALTGLVVNIACPAQASESAFQLSADLWHDTREELRRRFGSKLFVAAQCSAAGDIAPHFTRDNSYDRKPAARMLELKQRNVRTEIAHRLAGAIAEVLPLLPPTIETKPILKHRVETLALPLNRLGESDVAESRKEASVWRTRYEAELRKLAATPPPATGRWYVAVTGAYARMRWHEGVLERYERQRTAATHPAWPSEVHVVRLGGVALASNPFEYYLDYGIQIKARSTAAQTFLVQLAGSGTYVPSARSTKGGGYGSLPASNPVGDEGGELLREKTLEIIAELWK